MGFNDIHNTDLILGLGLGFASTPSLNLDDQHRKRSGPSLTLTLSADDVYNNLQPQDSIGASISLCNGKREKFRVDCEEVERERIASSNSRACDEDDYDGSNGRKKLRLTKSQSTLLEESFKQHTTLNPKHKQELAKELKLRPRQVEVWFQNRRARTKLKQTEVDCKELKKCYETLTEENKRLQKELQRLKSQNFAPPNLYMQLPSTTVTMCPSCERIGGGATTTSATVGGVGDNGSKRLMFSMASGPHVLTNQSAQLAS